MIDLKNDRFHDTIDCFRSIPHLNNNKTNISTNFDLLTNPKLSLLDQRLCLKLTYISNLIFFQHPEVEIKKSQLDIPSDSNTTITSNMRTVVNDKDSKLEENSHKLFGSGVLLFLKLLEIHSIELIKVCHIR